MNQIRISDLTDEPSPLICGVINISPESFYTDSIVDKVTLIEQKIRQMVFNGAKVIDVGALSTRPISLYGGKEITEDEELQRIKEVLHTLLKVCSELQVALCIDTQSARVAKYCLEAGVRVINDISGLTINPSMARILAEYDCDVVLMATHIKPGDISSIDDALGALSKSIKFAEESSINRDRIFIDPGFGGWQGRDKKIDLDLIKNFHKFHQFGLPVYIGVSRKSTISVLNGGKTPEERLIGSVILTNYLSKFDVRVIRTHDVKETILGLQVEQNLNSLINLE